MNNNNEKKQVTTIWILTILIIILIAIIVGLFFKVAKLKREANLETEQKLAQMRQELEQVKKQANKNADVTKETEQKSENKYTKQQVIELLKEKEQENKKYSLDLYKLKVDSIFGNTDSDNGKCVIIASYYVPNTLDENEYANLVSDGQIVLDGQKYVLKNDTNANETDFSNKGYGYLVSEKYINSGYNIYKIDGKYVLNDVPGLPSGTIVRNKIYSTIKFEVENTTEVIDNGTGKIANYANANHSGTMLIKLNATDTDIIFEIDHN